MRAAAIVPRRIDAHHHLWRYTAAEFGWIDDRMAALRRDFLLPELRRELLDAGVNGCVAVQAGQTLAETDFLLRAAEEVSATDGCSPIWGVVGWLPLAEESLPSLLETYRAHPRLCGLRHIVQAEPEGFLAGAAFNRGIAAMTDSRLVFDLLLQAGQLPEAIEFVDRHPRQQFVLDHLGKPPIASGALEPWRTHVRELARRPHVACKLSGMVTEARWPGWRPSDLRPFFEIVLEAFSPTRLMFGSDWPVLTVASSYGEWWQTVVALVQSLSGSEQDAILGGTAARVYRLSAAATRQPHPGAE